MQQIKINVRLAVILCLSGLLLIITVFLVHGYQKKRHSEANLAHARKYVEGVKEVSKPQERSEAISQAWKAYQGYLQTHPDDIEVQREGAIFLYEEALWMAENEAMAKAISLAEESRKIFERILRQEENRNDIRKEFIDILIELGDYKTALEHIKFLCDFPKSEKKLEKLLSNHNLLERATKTGVVSFKLNGGYDYSKLFNQDDKTINRKELLGFLEDDYWILLPDSNLLNLFGECQIHEENVTSAIEAFKRAVDICPSNLDAYESLINALRSNNDSENAEIWLADVVLKNPDAFRSYLIRGRDRLQLARATPKEKAFEWLDRVKWDAFRATQQAIRQILECAEKKLPRAEVTKKLQQSYNVVVNHAPSFNEKIKLRYEDALREAVDDITPVAKLMKERLEQEERAKKDDTSATNASAMKTILEEALGGCRDGLLLAVDCEKLKAILNPQEAKIHLDVARNLAKDVQKMFPENEKVYIALADIEIQARNIDEVINWMEKGVKQTKDNTTLLWQLGTIYAAKDQPEKARQTLKRLKDNRADSKIIKHLEASLDMQAKNWSAAATKFKDIRSEFILQPEEIRKIDYLLATCYGQSGRVEEEREALVRVNTSDRSWRPALVRLAKTRIKTGQLEEAAKDYQAILRLPDADPQRYLEYADLLLKIEKNKPKSQRNYKAVEDAIKQASEAMPDSFAVKLLESDLLVAKGEFAKVRKQLQQLHEQLSQAKQDTFREKKQLSREANSLKEGPMKKAKEAQAYKLLEKFRLYEAQQTHVWNNIVAIDLQQGNWQAAEKAIKIAQEKLGDTPQIRWLRAQKLVRESGKAAVKDLHPLAEELDGFDEYSKLWLLRKLAFMAIRLGDISQAEKLAQRVVKEESADIEMQKILFEVATKKKDLNAMKTALDQIRILEGRESAFWLYGKAFYLYSLFKQEKDPKKELIQEAQLSLLKARKMKPDWPAPAVFSAQICLSQGEISKAIDLYQQAVENGLRDPNVIRKLATLLAKRHRFKEADEVFNRLTQVQKNQIQDIGISASVVKAQLGDFDESLAMARKACKTSKNYRDFVWLGRILGVSAKQAEKADRKSDSVKLYQEGEQAFLKAIELESASVEPWTALVHFYSLFDKNDKAIETLQKAKKTVPSKEVNLMLAQSYETLGKVEDAATYYRKIINHELNDFEVAKSAVLFFMKNNFFDENKKLLNRIINQDIDATEEQVAWANRMLGFNIIREEGTGNIDKTIRLIDENLKNHPNSIPDLLAKADLLTSDPTGEGYDDAIRILQQVQSLQHNPNTNVEHKLADLYYLTDQWGKFKETMQSVLSKVDDHPQILAQYINRLAQHGEYAEGKGWLDQLKKIAPGNGVTVLAEYHLLSEQNEYDDFLEILKKWVDQRNKKLDQKTRLKLASLLCQKCAFRLHDKKKSKDAKKFEKQAEDFLLKYVQLEPKAESKLITLYAQQNNFGKVIRILNNIANKADPSVFGILAYNCVREGDFSKDQLARIQKILQRVSKAHPENWFVKMILALYEEHLDNPRQAEAILRKLLNEHPDNVDVMNCLTASLALQEKNLTEARQLIDKAIKIAKPESLPDLLDSRAMVALAQKRPQEAIKDLRVAIAKKPSNASFYFHLADALYQKGWRELAKNAIQKAQRLGLREATLVPTERHNYQMLNARLR